MHPKSISLAVSLLLALVVQGFAPSTIYAQKQIRWKFNPGDVRDLSIQQSMNMGMEVGGQNLEMKMNQTMVLRQTVDSVDDAGAGTLSQRFMHIKMKMEGPPGTSFEYDSASPEAPVGIGAMIAPIFQAMTKGKFESKVTPVGEIVDVKVPQEMLDAMAKTGGLPGMSQLLSKEGLGQLIRQSAAKFPQEPVKKGDSWNTSLDIKNPMIGTQTIKTTFTYDGEEVVENRPLDKLLLKLVIDFGEPPANSPVQAKVSEQSAAGFIRFDSAAGQLVDSQIDQEIKMQIETGGRTLIQTIKNKTVVTNQPVAR